MISCDPEKNGKVYKPVKFYETLLSQSYCKSSESMPKKEYYKNMMEERRSRNDSLYFSVLYQRNIKETIVGVI